MGIFSKKTYVCEKCGKEFDKRINLNGNICDACKCEEDIRKMELDMAVGGYRNYSLAVRYESYTEEEQLKIKEHKENLMKKFENTNGILKDELQNASDNYKNLTDEEAADVLRRMAVSIVSEAPGAVYTDGFFMPTCYDGLIVDAKDVFAVAYTSNHKIDAGSNDVISCAVFTNDPYVPVFPMVFVEKKGMFEIMQSKKGKENVKSFFEDMCTNLTYSVGELKELKKQIASEGIVKGNISLDFMERQLNSAIGCRELYSVNKLPEELFLGTIKMIDEMGYYTAEEANKILKMDKMFNGNYWKKQMKNL